MIDFPLPGTPVAIDIEEDNKDVNINSKSRPPSSSSAHISRSLDSLVFPSRRSSNSSNPRNSSISLKSSAVSLRSAGGGRPETASSRSSGSSVGSTGALSLSDYGKPPKDDTQWRRKLRPNCFIPPLTDKFICPACKEVLYYPVCLTTCDHVVCSVCLSDIMKGMRCCPVDRKPIERSQVIVDRDFNRELNSQKLNCPQHDLGCSWSGTYESFKVHFMECERCELICPNGCGKSFEKRRLDDHVMNECSLRMVTCEFCSHAVRVEKEIDHLKDCPRFPITCPNTCGKKQIPRENLTKHIWEECPYGEIKCPFRRMGCFFMGSREMVGLHIAEDIAIHMEMICQTMDDSVDKISEHQRAVEKHDSLIQDNVRQICHLVRMYGCQMLWKIDSWAQRVVDATSGKKTVLRSPPFFTGKYGYKLALTLLPNGDGKAKGKYISLYVCICKGEYDALATWPFNMVITLTLVDQCQDPNGRIDHSYTLKPNPCKENMPFLGQPLTSTNPSLGAQSFAPIDLMETRDYVRDDVIFIKVHVDDHS